MNSKNTRLLMQLEQTRREINRELINPEIREISAAEFRPIMEMVAKARAEYVNELFTQAKNSSENDRIDSSRLQELRVVFEELVAAANALETMVERGYVDVDD